MCDTLINGSWSIIVLCFIYFSFGFNPKILAERPKECATWVLENTPGVSPERLLSLQAMYISTVFCALTIGEGIVQCWKF